MLTSSLIKTCSDALNCPACKANNQEKSPKGSYNQHKEKSYEKTENKVAKIRSQKDRTYWLSTKVNKI